MEISEQAARQALMEQAREIDAAEQAKRAEGFAEHVRQHMTPERIAGYVEQIKKLQKVPLTAAERRQLREKWMYSTCIPGRLLPQLIMGPKGAAHPDWIPLERRLIMA